MIETKFKILMTEDIYWLDEKREEQLACTNMQKQRKKPNTFLIDLLLLSNVLFE
jgi:hypothetical protein